MSSRKQILVIDPACHTPEVEALNFFLGLASDQLYSYHLPALSGFQSFAELSEIPIAAAVILGSSVSVFKDPPEWQAELETKITNLINANIPILAICYGHQLLAAMHGGRVAFIEDGIKRLGVRHVHVKSMPEFGIEAHSGNFIVSHREIVTTLPEGFREVGSSTEFGFELLQHCTKPILTIQAHPEATEGFCQNNSCDLSEINTPFAHGHDLVSRFLQQALKKI